LSTQHNKYGFFVVQSNQRPKVKVFEIQRVDREIKRKPTTSKILYSIKNNKMTLKFFFTMFGVIREHTMS